MRTTSQEAAQRIIPKVLEALKTPKPVHSLAKDLGEPNEEDVKNVLYSLRLLGVIIDVHGDKATLFCVVSPDGAENLGSLCLQMGSAAYSAQRWAAEAIAKANGGLI